MAVLPGVALDELWEVDRHRRERAAGGDVTGVTGQ